VRRGGRPAAVVAPGNDQMSKAGNEYHRPREPPGEEVTQSAAVNSAAATPVH
jgi:hypothetical protein